MTYILVYLLIGVVTWASDMAKSRPSHPAIWAVALLVHLILGPILAAIGVAAVALHASGFIAGSIASAFMKGWNKGYDR